MADLHGTDRKNWWHGRGESLQLDSYLNATRINGVKFPSGSYTRLTEIEESGEIGELYSNGTEIVVRDFTERLDSTGFLRSEEDPANPGEYLLTQREPILSDLDGIAAGGTSGQVLTTDGTSASWQDASSSGGGGLPLMYLAYNDMLNTVVISPTGSGSGVGGYLYAAPVINSAGVTKQDAVFTLPSEGTWMIDVYANMELPSAGGTKRLNLYTVTGSTPAVNQWTEIENNTGVEVRTSVSIKAILPGGTQFFANDQTMTPAQSSFAQGQKQNYIMITRVL